MSTLADRLTLAMEKTGISQAELARACGVKPPSVSGWLSGKSKFLRGENLLKAAAALRVSQAWLATGEGSMEPSSNALDLLTSEVGDAVPIKRFRKIPVVGEVKGGDDGFLEETQYPVGFGDGYVEYPTTDPNAYAVRVRGDSMHPRYRAGEFVVVEPNIEAREGDDVVVICANGRELLKQLNWRRDGEVQLLSVNNGYAPVTLQCSEITAIALVAGRVRRSGLMH